MSNPRSVEMHFRMQESQEKFDYFLCSVTGALFAYMAQNYVPKKLELGISALEPLAMLVLVGSFFTGLLHIGYFNDFRRLNHVMLNAGEKAGKFATALAQGNIGGIYINEEGGQITGAQTMEIERRRCLEEIELCELGLAKGKRKMARVYWWRNALLCAGFLLLLGAKLLQPYSHSAQHSTISPPPTLTK
jgi:hypothetical protein